MDKPRVNEFATIVNSLFLAPENEGYTKDWMRKELVERSIPLEEAIRADERAKIRAWAERNNKEVGVLESEDSGDWLHATVVDYYGLLAFLDNLGLEESNG